MLQKWFNQLNRKQLVLIRVVVWSLSVVFIMIGLNDDGRVFVLGIVLITILLYLELGKKKSK